MTKTSHTLLNSSKSPSGSSTCCIQDSCAISSAMCGLRRISGVIQVSPHHFLSMCAFSSFHDAFHRTSGTRKVYYVGKMVRFQVRKESKLVQSGSSPQINVILQSDWISVRYSPLPKFLGAKKVASDADAV